MKVPFAPRRRLIGRLLVTLTRSSLSFLLAGARLFGGYAPFAVGMVGGAGAGWPALASLLGAVSGALVFLDFPHALRAAGCCVLLFSANNAFCENRVYRAAWFLPALTAALTAAVELIYCVRAGTAAEAVNCALAIALSAVFAPCARLVLAGREARREHPAASLMLLLGVLAALSVPELRGGVAPGRAAAVLALLIFVYRQGRAALAPALCIGLCVDLAAPGTLFLHTACFGFAALLTALLPKGSRVRAAMAFPVASALFTLPLGTAEALALLYECLTGTLLFLLTPSQLLHREAEREEAPPDADDALRRRLREAAAGLQELYDSVAHAESAPEENPAVVYDRAAEAVCRDCALRERCWVNEYNRTYTALSDATPALLRNGEARGADFPAYFADRCIRFPSFLSAVNAELRAYLLRLQYRRRLEEARLRSAGQYARFSALLTQAAEPSAAVTATLPYRVGLTLRPKGGERVSGDSAATFETETGLLCLLLSDGMGSGEAARRESAMAARLVERFLRSGVDAGPALRTLNSALNLRAEASDSFTTIDLLTVSLRDGEGELYKYGAAPTYIKRGSRVHRVCCGCLPAGLAAEEAPPETTRVRLEPGCFLVMVTDGVADATDDGWLQELLRGWEGTEPKQLVAAVLAESAERKGMGDDAGVLALYLPAPAGATEV